MSYLAKLSKLNKIVSLLSGLKNSSHAVLLYSEDEILLKSVADLLVIKENCDDLCFQCANCKKVINGNAVDVKHFGFEKNIVVEDSNFIVSDSFVVPLEFEKKFYILNNFHKATLPAQNKLLKVVEEPKDFVKFIILTTKLEDVLPTIKSRCEIHKLPKFSGEELENLFEYKLNDAKRFNSALDYADGNLTKLEQFYNSTNFMDMFKTAFDVVAVMGNSSQVLSYASKIVKFKDEIESFFHILSTIFSDMLLIKNEQEKFIQNKHISVQLNLVSSAYTELALVNIINLIHQTKQKLGSNANVNGVVDNLLIKILEIKHICK